MEEKKDLAPKKLETACEISGKALLQLVPSLGPLLASVIGDVQKLKKEERFLEFLNGLKEDLEGLEQHVNEDFIAKEDFVDITEDTLRKIITTRQEEKRVAFRRILVNSMLSSIVSYDEVEEFVRILDRLRPEHIHMMRILKDPIAYNEEIGNPVGKGQAGGITSISQIMSRLLPDWKESHIREVATVLEGDERLVQSIVSRYGSMMTDQGIYHLQNTLTEKGKRFCSFILEVGRANA